MIHRGTKDYAAQSDPAKNPGHTRRWHETTQTERRFVLTLEAVPGVDAAPALRAALKLLRRRFGLRCTDIRGARP